jgi:hypothetical protein
MTICGAPIARSFGSQDSMDAIVPYVLAGILDNGGVDDWMQYSIAEKN